MLTDEMGEEWLRVERAIWPDGPAHGHGSGEYAALKARIIKRLVGLRPYIRHGATCALQAVRDNAPDDELCTCGLREVWEAPRCLTR